MSALDRLKERMGGKGMASLFGFDKRDIDRLRKNMDELVKQMQEVNKKLDKIIKILEKSG